MVLIPPMVFARNRRCYLSCSSMEGAGLEKITLKYMATENRSSVLVGKERKRKVVLQICTHG